MNSFEYKMIFLLCFNFCSEKIFCLNIRFHGYCLLHKWMHVIRHATATSRKEIWLISVLTFELFVQLLVTTNMLRFFPFCYFIAKVFFFQVFYLSTSFIFNKNPIKRNYGVLEKIFCLIWKIFYRRVF